MIYRISLPVASWLGSFSSNGSPIMVVIEEDHPDHSCIFMQFLVYPHFILLRKFVVIDLAIWLFCTLWNSFLCPLDIDLHTCIVFRICVCALYFCFVLIFWFNTCWGLPIAGPVNIMPIDCRHPARHKRSYQDPCVPNTVHYCTSSVHVCIMWYILHVM